jgi:hypothetical protein
VYRLLVDASSRDNRLRGEVEVRPQPRGPRPSLPNRGTAVLAS